MTKKAKICLIITVLLLAVGVGSIFASAFFPEKATLPPFISMVSVYALLI